VKSTNKKPSGVRGIPQSFNRQPGHALQLKPVVGELKAGVSVQSMNRTFAPPVYRPQAKPEVVQPKTANSVANRKPPVAPPVYRPQQLPRVLQTNISSAQRSLPDQAPRYPVAPPVYRPEAKTLVQPKAIAQLRKSPTPPAYRPEQKGLGQPKIVSAAQARTPPKTHPVFRSQAKPMNETSGLPAHMKSKTVPKSQTPASRVPFFR